MLYFCVPQKQCFTQSLYAKELNRYWMDSVIKYGAKCFPTAWSLTSCLGTVMHLLIHSSNIYQCLIWVSHIKGNDVEMNKSGIPSKYLHPGGWKYAGSSAFTFSVEQVRASIKQLACLWVHSPPSPGTSHWHWSLCYKYEGFSSEKAAWGHICPGPSPSRPYPGKWRGEQPQDESLKGSPGGRGFVSEPHSQPFFPWHSALVCVNLCSQGPSCSGAAEANNTGSQISYSVTKIVTVGVVPLV